MQTNVLSKPKTILEVFQMLPEGTRAEVINEKLYMSPAPTLKHQNTTLDLASEILFYVRKNKLGKVFVSPVDVYLDQKNVVQPDIVFVSSEKKSLLETDGIYGSPDLIIEVLSPGTKKFDLDKKKKLYEKFSVKEYWIVDPETKESLGFQWKNSKFILMKQDKAKLVSLLLKHTFTF